MRKRRRLGPAAGLAAMLAVSLLLSGACAAGATGGARAVWVSRTSGSNAEVMQAVDGRYVYEAWIKVKHGIGFARSVNGGRTFGPALTVPGSLVGKFHAWDPAVAVARDGTLYVAYMMNRLEKSPKGGFMRLMTPVVAVSHDHGRSFARISQLPVPDPTTPPGNWGDREFVAVARDGTVYVTWDYGPRVDQVKAFCPPSGSCAFSAGDFNAVIQKSTNGGATWTMPTSISPGFPLGGVYAAPIVAEPNGALDVLYWQHPTNLQTLAVSAGHQYFTRSTDGGAT